MAAFMLIGAPCGALLFFARTGHWAWGPVLAVPILAAVQSVSVLTALPAFPHSPAMHVAAALTTSLLFILAIHGMRTRCRRIRRPA
jgi:hypothetical protein